MSYLDMSYRDMSYLDMSYLDMSYLDMSYLDRQPVPSALCIPFVVCIRVCTPMSHLIVGHHRVPTHIHKDTLTVSLDTIHGHHHTHAQCCF